MNRFAALLPVAALLAAPALAAAAGAPAVHPAISLRDYRSLVNLASPQFSPGGGRIAFLAIRADFPHDRYDATLMSIGTRGGAPQTLVAGMRGLHSPRWAPDGRAIAFVARSGRQPAQIFLVPAAGGKPRQLGFAPNGVEQFAWSPNGRAIAYVTPDSGISARAKASHHDLFTIHNDDYQINAAPTPSHIWLLPVAGGPVRQLTFGPTSVLENPPPLAGSVSAPVWSPDGKTIVYAQQVDADDSDTDKTTIVALDVATGAVRPLTDKTSYEYTPSFSPDGKTVAFFYPHGPGPLSFMDIDTVSVHGGKMHDITNGAGDIATTYAWRANGNGFLGIMDMGVVRDLLQARIDPHLCSPSSMLTTSTKKLKALLPSAIAVSAKGAVAMVADSARSGPELYLYPSEQSWPPVQLTSFNARFNHYAYPKSDVVDSTAPDGQWSDGIITYPNGYRLGDNKKYPLVVYLHGGPEAASSEDFDAGEIGPLRDLFAARGYIVYEPNYRGSDNMSDAHERAIYRDPGVGPESDIIAGIKKLERWGIVDPKKIAIVGHSYGGYLTTWSIAHHHFWRSAVVADGAVDWTEEYELSGDGNMAWVRASLGGSPWNPKSAALYRTASPMTYAGNITTPTLILSGTADITVPITESFALYHALASRHVPVRFIGIPGAHHLPQDPVHLELYYRAIVRWVVAHM